MVAHLIVTDHLIVKWQYHLTVTLRHVIVKWGIHTACTLLVCITYYQSNNNMVIFITFQFFLFHKGFHVLKVSQHIRELQAQGMQLFRMFRKAHAVLQIPTQSHRE